MNFSGRINQIANSQTMEIKRQADQLKAKGADIIDFGAGDPDFDTPLQIREAAKGAMDEGFTHYTSPEGIDELKDALIEKYKRKYKATYNPNEVMVTVGAKGALFNIALALFEEGDEVILPSPYWVSYVEQIKFTGAKPVILETKQVEDFKINRQELEDLISKKTKAILINSPNNPTGQIIDQRKMKYLVDIAYEYDLYLISDECYEDIIFDRDKFTSLSALDKKRSLVVSSVSKTYAMTGWRLGHIMGPKEVITQLKKLQGQSVTCVNSIAQKAAVLALSSADQEVERMRREYLKRREVLMDGLASCANLSCIRPEGTFYAFPCVDKFIRKNPSIKGSYDLAMYILNKAHVAVVPGIAFGQEGYVRISFAQPIQTIEEGINRLRKVFSCD